MATRTYTHAPLFTRESVPASDVARIGELERSGAEPCGTERGEDGRLRRVFIRRTGSDRPARTAT